MKRNWNNCNKPAVAGTNEIINVLRILIFTHVSAHKLMHPNCCIQLKKKLNCNAVARWGPATKRHSWTAICVLNSNRTALLNSYLCIEQHSTLAFQQQHSTLEQQQHSCFPATNTFSSCFLIAEAIGCNEKLSDQQYSASITAENHYRESLQRKESAFLFRCWKYK